MKDRLISLLCILLIVAGLSASAGYVSKSKISKTSLSSLIGNHLSSLNQPSRRSLLSLSDELDTALVAALNGTIYLMEPKSGKMLWSFTSGPPIYSSYQAPINPDNDTENSGLGNGYFIDCGDDWELYAHGRLGKTKLPMTVEDYIHIMPHIDEDGGVVIGSKRTTVFLVDAKTGRLIHTYGLADSSSKSQSNEENNVYNTSIEERKKFGSMNWTADELPLYITRTDYSLKSFVPRSDKVLWNLTFAEIGAAFLCHDNENSIGDTLLGWGYELPSEPGVRFNMPLPCQSRAVVYRFRSHHMLESFSRPNRLPEAHREDMALPGSTSNPMLPVETHVDKFLGFNVGERLFPPSTSNMLLPSQLNADNFPDSQGSGSESDLVIPKPSVTDNSVVSGAQLVKMPSNGSYTLYQGSSRFPVIPFIFILVGFAIYSYTLITRKQVKLSKEPDDLDTKTVSTKRKKIRKSGKNSGIVETKDEATSSGFKDGFANIESDARLQLNLNQSYDGSTDGRTIGKLFVSNREIAKGSNGTVVLEGIYEGRPVAVKRLVRAHHDIAFKEIQNLIVSDRHPNIVRWHGVEYDQDFVYLSLERCICSLNDLILMYSYSFGCQMPSEDQATEVLTEYKVRLGSMKGVMQDIKLLKANGYPSPILLKLMRDMVSGLMHLHELGIIHRDLKPQNVLIVRERSLCAKLSDMGISKRLTGDMSSLGQHPTGFGSSGWQAPEQLLHGRQTRAIDMFSLGCVLFFCITGGKHPFGESLERDINIVKNRVDLFLVEHIPEAVDLFSHLLDPTPELRPKASEVLHHPLFWNSEMRLSFLRDTSDRVELEDRETDSDLLQSLENAAPLALGTRWDEKMESAFLHNIGRYRRYNFNSVRDLLRVMRNKLSHYRELPIEIQELLGPVPDGYDGYFASRFPKLFIEVYKVMYKYCREEECFQKYFNSSVV